MPATTTAPPPRRLGLRKRVAFALAAIVLVAALVEALSFLLAWVADGAMFSWSRVQAERDRLLARSAAERGIAARVHPYVGFVEEPRDDSGVIPFGQERPVPVSTFGYLDRAGPIHARAEGKVIVGILGGSVASLFAVNGAERLRADLHESPSFAGKELVFVNLALGAYKQPQQLMTLSYLLALGARFDIVLNIDGFNEVALYESENGGRRIFPAYPHGWYGRVEVADPQLGRLLGEVAYVNSRRADLARTFSKPPWRYSVLCNLLWEALDRGYPARIHALKEEFRRTSPARGNYFVTGPPSHFATREALYEHLASLWANSSIQLAALCSANGIRYHHFLQPNQYLAGSKPLGRRERREAYRADHPYRPSVELGYPLLIRNGRDLRARGVRLHDLTGLFAGIDEPIYADDCCHYNRRGYEIMADRVAAAILDDAAPAGRR
jgi:hypothetical protein